MDQKESLNIIMKLYGKDIKYNFNEDLANS